MTVREILHGRPSGAARAGRRGRPATTSPGDESQGLIDDLIDTMRAANGAGLAANADRRASCAIAVIEVTHNPRYPYKPPIPLTVVDQPGDRADRRRAGRDQRGLPVGADLRGNVQRHVNIRVRYLDRDGVEHDEVKRGLTAARSSTSATTSTACCSSTG